MPDGWGWASSVEAFLSVPREVILQRLDDHFRRLMGFAPAGQQAEAWRDTESALRAALAECLVVDATISQRWSVVFEYELPLEGGRRPDLVVLAGGAVVVVEFKSASLPQQADLDQVRAYARDLSDYHAATHGRIINTVLVVAGATPEFARELDGTAIVAPEHLARYLFAFADDDSTSLEAWLDAAYAPLPTLVDAARRIFLNDPPPHVVNAQSAGIPETVDLLGRLVEEAALRGEHVLAFITGVPGSGKTLAGLRLVYDRAANAGGAIFLSGNGPLVQVLQDALHSRAFVRDLHAFVRTYALSSRARVPSEHVIVFDEAQRAWDKGYMSSKRGVEASEPQLLVQIGERVPGWVALVGLIGEGQEIHAGEEGGVVQWWEAATPPYAARTWKVHCSPRLAQQFPGLPVIQHDKLDLTVSLRSRRADQLHDWVRHLFAASIPLAARLALRVQAGDFPMYVTRDLEGAKAYVRRRYEDEPAKTYGFIASSHAGTLPDYGIDNSFITQSRMNVARWFNAPLGDPLSCTALTRAVTEFRCQGLELDCPIVCWGEDMRWAHGSWALTPARRRYPLTDPVQLLRNTYRVLLTRGRDGVVIYVPDLRSLDETEHILLAAGVRPLPDILDLALEA